MITQCVCSSPHKSKCSRKPAIAHRADYVSHYVSFRRRIALVAPATLPGSPAAGSPGDPAGVTSNNSHHAQATTGYTKVFYLINWTGVGAS